MSSEKFSIQIAPSIRAALEAGKPVVALESTVVAHGLPYPQNLEVAHQIEAEVLEQGAIPATIGVVEGVPTIGLTEEQLTIFAKGDHVLKLSRRDIAFAVTKKRNGATTVAATMALASLAGIQVFATGGIGGVHLGAHENWDISADLLELSRTSVLVVCAGAKAILDLPATLEQLETEGVPVIGYGCTEFPAFYTPRSGLSLTSRVETPQEAAMFWQAHKEFGGGGGAILAVPPPASSAINGDKLNEAIGTALIQAEEMGVKGQAVTPFLLRKVSELTEGASLKVNIALLLQNAKVAAQVARALQ
ncbi:MAG: pseudouridine-5'-phosphate glycosidase [Blastocatellia bacterium]|nr:pseudouridine-5'-phosphate glycosidase [Blastocatellia bacterium]